MCFWVWGWWVGVGWSGFVLQGLGLVGWGWSVVISAVRFGRGGLGSVGGGLCAVAYLGAMLSDLGATLAHVGATLALLWAMGWWSVVVCAVGFVLGGLGWVVVGQ